MYGQLGKWVEAFNAAVAEGNARGTADLFADGAFWRDFLAVTWDIRTLEGRESIFGMLADRLPLIAPFILSVDAAQAEHKEGFIAFQTAFGRGRGYIRLSDGGCHTLLTALEELEGHEETKGARRSPGFPASNSTNWAAARADEQARLGVTEQPYVLIVGGGQGGLALAARLRHLSVPALVVDRFARAGDQWRQRYASLSLHDPVWYDHMPYLPFPETWPVFTPKDKMADWLESYEKLMELVAWHSTECRNASFDAATGKWTVELNRDGCDITVHPTHLVLAIGNAGRPNRPTLPGADSFKGIQRHSSDHPGGAGMEGKRVVVIGSNNSAHDICADLVDHGADVTMIQRSSTHVVRQETFVDLWLGRTYSHAAVSAGLTTDKADLLAASLPLRMLPAYYGPLIAQLKRIDADFYEALTKAGFALDYGEDDTGIQGKYLRRAAGYYIDVGASQMIIDGRIKLKRGGIERIDPSGVVLTGGEHVPADVIIYATGFGSMDQTVADLISPEVAARVGKVWGYGSGTPGDPGPWEGELRNMWKPTAQPNLWFHGGNLAQSRFYSLLLALQLKGRYENLGIPVYVEQPELEQVAECS